MERFGLISNYKDPSKHPVKAHIIEKYRLGAKDCCDDLEAGGR